MNEPAEKLGQYQLIEKIAQGGMAQVYKAKTTDATGTERLVVIKRILPHISADPEYVEMLVDEAKIAVHFTHGNIAQVYDLGRVKDDYFIVMEYVDGKTFSQISKKLAERRQKFPLDILLYSFVEICHGLSYVHRKKGADGKSLGVVHRDISPQNIILSYGGRLKIIDFGVAKAQVKEGKTESGVLKGKFAYMSPEQSRGDNIDYRSDIFSIGTLLWEMATGDRLFKRKSNPETIAAVQKAKFDLASAHRPNLPSDLDKIIKKALQRHPKNRYQDAADMAADLEKLLIAQNPEFKPAKAAEFVYKLFGPEDDEKDAGKPLFDKDPTPIVKGSLSEPSQISVTGADDSEAPTLKEHLDTGTPIVTIQPRFSLKAIITFSVLAGFFLAVTILLGYHFLQGRKAYLSFSGVDHEMMITVDQKRLGDPHDQAVVSAGVRHVFKVVKPGYGFFKDAVTLKGREHRIIAVKLKKEIPPYGDVTIKTVPPGATLYLDDMEWREKTPVTILHLKSDKTYKIGMYLENYQYHNQEVVIVGGKDTLVEHGFVMNNANLSIATNPPGAHVLIENQDAGQTPVENFSVPPAKDVKITVTKEGHVTQEMTLNLSAGEDKKITFDLVQKQP
jgi:serine/threonine protein kinase